MMGNWRALSVFVFSCVFWLVPFFWFFVFACEKRRGRGGGLLTNTRMDCLSACVKSANTMTNPNKPCPPQSVLGMTFMSLFTRVLKLNKVRMASFPLHMATDSQNISDDVFCFFLDGSLSWGGRYFVLFCVFHQSDTVYTDDVIEVWGDFFAGARRVGDHF